MCTPELLEAAADRWLNKVQACPWTDCWLWTGGKSRGGQKSKGQEPYGSFWIAEGLIVRAHIFSAAVFGLIDGVRVPKGYNLDHTCENTLCVSPFHLELVTGEVNQMRKREPRPHPTYRQLFEARSGCPF